jgi:enoyl-[acyl-carrier protein] reductase III
LEAQRKALNISTCKANLMAATGIQVLVDHTINAFGKIDALVFNSAIGVHKPLAELGVRHLSGVWGLNVGAFFDLASRLRPHMPHGSRIIAVSSEGARKAVRQYGAVGSSKAALEALCRQMAAEWALDGILVNLVAPGLLETDTLSVWPDAAERVQAEVRSSPLRRLVRLEEVAQVVHFLCSRASSGIVGQTLIVDGGKSISAIAGLS